MHQLFLIQIRILNPEQDQLNLYTGIEKMYSDMIFFFPRTAIHQNTGTIAQPQFYPNFG